MLKDAFSNLFHVSRAKEASIVIVDYTCCHNSKLHDMILITQVTLDTLLHFIHHVLII